MAAPEEYVNFKDKFKLVRESDIKVEFIVALHTNCIFQYIRLELQNNMLSNVGIVK